MGLDTNALVRYAHRVKTAAGQPMGAGAAERVAASR